MTELLAIATFGGVILTIFLVGRARRQRHRRRIQARVDAIWGNKKDAS